MPQKQKHTATVTEDGTLQGRSAGEALISWLSDVFPLFAGGRVEIVVQRPKRTLRQNRYYWKIIQQVCEGFRRAGVNELHMVGPKGEMVTLPVTKDLVHTWFKNKYLTPKEPGEEPSTTNLDQTEMTAYIDRIKHDEDVRKLDVTFRDEDEIRA